jgi:organic radical activating enzyme
MEIEYDMRFTTLVVSEIFYSLQGEGARAGTANHFIRLQGCKAKDACYASGVRCDTEFESGYKATLDFIEATLRRNGAPKQCANIIWTGGEPASQLTWEIVEWFKEQGYYQCIETSGLLPVPKNLDYVVVSPKVAEHVIAKNFTHVSELRYVRHAGQAIPEPSIEADYYCLSPHSDGFTINRDNLTHCIELCKQNPTWRLSVQQHKLWNVL